MGLCGLALAIKQTTLFEGVFFGLAGLWQLRRLDPAPGRLAATALAAMAIAAVPMLAIGGWYAAHGWWAEWWNAMVTSNLRRQGIGLPAIQHNILAIFLLTQIFLFTALFGLKFHNHDATFRPYRGFVVCWAIVSLLGFVAMPNFFDHYALPLLVPVTVLAALGLSHPKFGPVLLAANVIVASILGTTFDFAWHRASRQSFAAMEATIERYRGDRPLLLLHGPLLLYPASGSSYVSPLVFPEHLINRLEANVSHLDTKRELQRLLAARPSVVLEPAVYDLPAHDGPVAPIKAYLAANCRLVSEGDAYEIRHFVKHVSLYACR
jgi:hypothetical protein